MRTYARLADAISRSSAACSRFVAAAGVQSLLFCAKCVLQAIVAIIFLRLTRKRELRATYLLETANLVLQIHVGELKPLTGVMAIRVVDHLHYRQASNFQAPITI
jgi:hypothetical protein